MNGLNIRNLQKKLMKVLNEMLWFMNKFDKLYLSVVDIICDGL